VTVKKNVQKTKTLKLHRETLARLDNEELAKAAAQFGHECTGCASGCGIFPNEV
jgi:hypothetical protein